MIRNIPMGSITSLVFQRDGGIRDNGRLEE